LAGIVNERAYQGEKHWLIFLFEATRPIGHDEVTAYEFDEGTLVWVPIADVASAGIPETDRTIMWPNVQAHRGGFFMVDIDCSGGVIEHRLVESWKAR
jgi:8-oxo-dGTP diphosphatase